jgi:steroid delta-isomerase-like uncharacterized protein
MSTETNKATIRRSMEQVWNKHRVDLLEEFYTEDAVLHTASFPSRSGLDAVKEVVAMMLNAYPDIQTTIEDEIAEGDKVVVRWTMSATHQGELLGIPPTGKQITNAGINIYYLVNGKIAELWFWPDNLNSFQQMGVIPALGVAE